MTIEELENLEDYKLKIHEETKNIDVTIDNLTKLGKKENIVVSFGVPNDHEYGDWEHRYCVFPTVTYLNKSDSKVILNMIIEQYKLESEERLKNIKEEHGIISNNI